MKLSAKFFISYLILSILNSYSVAQVSYVWLSIAPLPNKNISIGESFTNTLSISSWNGVPGAFNIKIKYDTEKLTFENLVINESSPFYPQSFADLSESTIGSIQLSCFQTDPNYPSDSTISLIDFTWKLKSYGNDSLTIINIEVTDMVELNWNPIEVISYETKINLATKVENNYIPVEYYLENNYPNPFNNATILQYQIPKETKVTLRIYNILGQLVATLVDQIQKPGVYKLTWDGRNNNKTRIASGVYIYSIETKEFTKSKKMLLLK